MSGSKITRMANQIATFFLSQPPEEGPKGVANHINRFWEPRMRREFFQIIEQGGEGMMPMVLEAAKLVNRPKEMEKVHLPQ